MGWRGFFRFYWETTMTLLEAVNLALRSTGEKGVASINSAHPKISTVLAEIDTASKRIQKRGWWFNTHAKLVLEPIVGGPNAGKIDVSGYDLVVPTMRSWNYYPANGFLVNGDTLAPVTGTSVEATVRWITPTTADDWLTLPDVYTDYAANVAALAYAANYDADPLQLKKLELAVQASLSMLNADNTRYRRLNLFASGSTGQALQRAWGGRYGRTF